MRASLVKICLTAVYRRPPSEGVIFNYSVSIIGLRYQCHVLVLSHSPHRVLNAQFNSSKMKTVTNAYILNLALADECFLIGIPFLIVTMINGKRYI